MAVSRLWTSCLLFVFSIAISNAQDAVLEDYIKIVSQFEKRVSIAYQAEYHYFTDLSATNPQQQLTIQVYKTEKATYYAYEQQEVLQTKEKVMTIDHLSKSIYVHQLTATTQPNKNLSDYIEWIELLELKGKKLQQPDGQQLLSFTNNSDTQTNMKLSYEPNTSLIREASIIFDFSDKTDFFPEYDQTKWIVRFTNYELKSVRIPISFDEIIQHDGRKIKGIGKYVNYAIEQI